MWPRFNRNDVRIIAHYLGTLMMIFGLTMVIPLTVSIIYGEWATSSHYVFGMGVAFVLGALFRLAKIEPQSMGRKNAIAITGLIWVVGAVIAAVPLYLSGQYASFLDAVFEGVSGLTATGLSLALDVDHMSMADNMWRFAMQFVGGQGVVVVALSLGIFARTGNVLYASEAREESVVPNIKKTARFILQFSTAAVVIGTLVSFVILFFVGMEPLRGFFHALWITIGAYDTGGFGAVSLSLIPYHSWPLEVAAMLLMMLGALSFAVVAQVHKGNWREFVRDIEVRVLALWTVGMVVIFVAALAVGDFLTENTALMRRGVFTIISATTNTGFLVLTTEQITTLLSSGALLLLAISMAVGGSSASTAGGIKALRVGMIFKGIGLSVRRVLQPRSAQVVAHYNHIGKHQLAPELLSGALIITSLYVISYVLGALVGIAYGYDAVRAIFESISAASNAGLSSGIVRVGMPVPLEILYILQMWLGRLEFITLLALFASLFASLLPRRKPKKDKTPKTHEWNSKGFIHSKSAVVLALLLAALLALAPLRSGFAASNNQEQSTSGESVTVSISELAKVPEQLDHVTVQFEGEVIGDRINAGSDHVWITMSDGSEAISVFLPRNLEQQIHSYGNYGQVGTSLRVSGEFRLACDEHDGTSDVHVTAIVDVLEIGGERDHPVNPLFFIIGVGLAVIAAGLLVFYNYLSRRRR